METVETNQISSQPFQADPDTRRTLPGTFEPGDPKTARTEGSRPSHPWQSRETPDRWGFDRQNARPRGSSRSTTSPMPGPHPPPASIDQLSFDTGRTLSTVCFQNKPHSGHFQSFSHNG